MAGSSMEDRIKEGPLAPRWNDIMSKNKELGKAKEAMSLISDVGSFDKNLVAGKKIADDIRDALVDAGATMVASQNKEGKIIDGHMKAFENLRKQDLAFYKKTADTINKLGLQGQAAALDPFKDLIDNSNDFVTEANEMFKDIIDARQEYSTVITKSLDDAKKKVNKSDADKKKLESDCDSLETSIRKSVVEVQKQAIRAHNDKLANLLKTFLTHL
jgi:hypothetical protein